MEERKSLKHWMKDLGYYWVANELLIKGEMTASQAIDMLTELARKGDVACE